MNTIISIAATGGLLFVCSTALAQTAPASFPECQAEPSTAIRIGSKTTYKNCAPSLIAEEYGSLFLSFAPPTARDLQTAPAAQRNGLKRALKTFLRFTVPQVRSGLVDLTVTAIASDGTRTPFHVETLASFSVDETKGLNVETLSSTANNQIGPRFRIRDGESFEVTFNVRYSSQTRPQITQVLTLASKTLAAVGLNYVPSLTSTALQPVAALEQKIGQSVGVTTPDSDKTRLSFSPGGDSAVQYVFLLDPNKAPDGKIFVGLQRRISVFPGKHEVNAGVVRFEFPDGDPGIVRTFQSVRQQQLNDTVAAAMSPSLFAQLKSTSPADFQMACEGLTNTLETGAFNFTASDRLAARWAFAFTSANIGAAAVRSVDCASSFIAIPGLQDRGLPVRAQELVLPAAWQSARDMASASSVAAAQAFADALDKAVAGRSQQIRARQTPAPAGVIMMNVAGFGQFAGQAAAAGPISLGVFTRTDAMSIGDVYAGETIIAGNTVVLSGYGEYVFAANQNASSLATRLGRGPIRRYVGQLNNSMFDGYGRLEWADDTVFEGQFSADQPYRGTLTLPDGVTRYGTFSNGRLNGIGVESTLMSIRWGRWTNGNLPVPNPPL